MNFELRALLRRVLPGSAWFAAVLIAATAMPAGAHAQVVERGIQGGVVGAIIGGITGGGRGAGTGAAIGAGVGVVTGAIERDANMRAAYGPGPGYGPAPGYGPGPAYGPGPGGGGGLVYNTQVSLQRLGYNPGPPDGMFGRQTSDAISQFQHANRLPVTGQPSPQLLNYMIAQGG